MMNKIILQHNSKWVGLQVITTLDTARPFVADFRYAKKQDDEHKQKKQLNTKKRNEKENRK